MSDRFIANTDSDGNEAVATTVFRDVTMIALATILVIVLLLLPWLQPKGHQEETSLTPPGSVIVELIWPDSSHSDVDLWVQAPNDEPVGYYNKGGVYFNLLRDDLGKIRDVTPINYETSYSRGIGAGEQIVNVHLYRLAAGEGPVPVTIRVSVRETDRPGKQQLFIKHLQLEHEGQELTVARFNLTAKGRPIGVVHDLPRSLVEPSKRQGYRRQQRQG